MNYLNHCLVLHPLNDVKDVIDHTGLVREFYEIYESKIIYFIKKEYDKLLRKHYSDLPEIVFEVFDDFNKQTIFKKLLSIYKNCKIRMFFGEFDSLRLDKSKNTFASKYNNTNYDPYIMYGFDPSLKYKNFIINKNEDDDLKTINLIKSVANMDYRLFSNGCAIPQQYKRNATIAIHVDKIFNNTNYFDSIVLIEKTKHIHITSCKMDIFSVFILHLWRSNLYPKLFEKKTYYFFYKDEDNFNIDELPESWKKIKIEND